MLKELYVENFALIEKLQLPFSEGLNVLSGETGAGKSLIIDAMSLIMGARSQQEFIRTGVDKCLVQAVFDGPFSAEVIAVLNDVCHISCDFLEDDYLILARELQQNGKGICRINNVTVPLSSFRILGRALVNIHGQMEHISLLDGDKQIEILDSFAGEKAIAQKVLVQEAFAVWQQLEKEKREYEAAQQDWARNIDFLSFQLDEIAQAGLVPGEQAELEQEKTLLENSVKISQGMEEAIGFLRGGEYGGGALDGLLSAKQALSGLAHLDDRLQDLEERLGDIYYNAEDCMQEISHYQQEIPEDMGRLDEINERLDQIKKILRKYGNTVEEVLCWQEEHSAELEGLLNKQENSAHLDDLIAEKQADYQKKAAVLTQLREAAGEALRGAINGQLQDLQMKQADILVQLIPGKPSSHGNESVELMIRSNVGEDYHPVAKIASGGEMSRVMLAVKVVIAQLDHVGTIIFDEVDTGMGGEALNAVAVKLKAVARYGQALCVTHNPVVAGFGDSQIYIYKETNEGRTATQAVVLDEEGRLQEICRMLAGENITEAAIARGKEILAQGRS
ncbi:MAG: DNA repair protein RecN [Peptococcaceae bacterium]|nr:DNA repair protein RecN [Peptococcaceae bacterium]